MADIGNEIAAGVKDAIDAASLASLPQSVVRSHLPEYDLDQLKDLGVTIIALDEEETLLTRAAVEGRYMCGVALHKAVDPKSVQEVDELIEIQTAIRNLIFDPTSPTLDLTTSDATCIAATRVRYDLKYLQEEHLYFGLINFTFKAYR